MADDFRHTEQQHEGQEHLFLDYRHVDIYFIYSFTWDMSARSWDELCKDLVGNVSETEKGWTLSQLHDRNIYDNNAQLMASYQPSLLSQRQVLERHHTIQKQATLILPMKTSVSVTDSVQRRIQFCFSYTLRIFDNGTCTCTFQSCLHKKSDDDNGEMFEKIHAFLRLAKNVDYQCPDFLDNANTEKQIGHLTDAYLLIPSEVSHDADEDWSLYPKGEYCSLHNLFNRMLNEDSLPWAPHEASKLWNDGDVLNRADPSKDFQSPFIVTVAEVERNSFLRFRKQPTLDVSREVGSIMCKLTLDNRTIREDYLHLSEDYITKVLDYDPVRKGLINYCLDRRLFFSFSKRGAIAITAKLTDLPACFVLPSFLNLLEIVRARWYLSCVLNMRIDKEIDKLARAQPDASPSIEDGADFDSAIKSLVGLRHTYTRFLQDPVPYLFDGGSVTEIAERAMVELGIETLSESIHRKMQILDAIRRDREEGARLHRMKQFEKELRLTQNLLGENGDTESR